MEEHQTKINQQSDLQRAKSEKQLKRLYERILADLLKNLAVLYAKYEKDGKLPYEEMAKFNRMQNLEKDIIEQINTLTAEARASIMKMLKERYLYAFEYMAYGIEKEAQARLAYAAVPLATIEAAINNPITGLTLNETLAARRVQVIASVKREIIQGMVRGDRYKRTAERVTGIFQGDFKKAIRVVRTEGHRIQEAAQLAAVEKAHAQGVIMTKKWNSLQDRKVRTGPAADHRKMDGNVVPVDELFDLGAGKKGAAPGNTGFGEHDIYCRCFTTYSIERVEKVKVEKLARLTFEEWRKERLKTA